MLVFPGLQGNTCDGPARREFLRVGSLGILGLSLPRLLQNAKLQAAAPKVEQGGNFGRAKQVILLFLQGGPSHLDIWDPKPDAPSNIRGEFKPIPTNVSGIQISETMPLLAKQMDKVTLIRSMSYTPTGLFNHTAAIYQMLTGYEPSKVSPSGQLEPPSPADFPTAGSHIAKMLPPTEPVLPFVEMPRPLQESNIIGKGGAAGFLGKAYDPYRLYQNPNEPIKLDDLTLRSDVGSDRLQGRFELLRGINGSMPQLEKELEKYALDEYYSKAFDLVLSGKARDAFDLTKESDAVRDRYGRHKFGQGALMARRLIEAGTRFVQLNWPAVANGNPEIDAWDTHTANFKPLRELHCPKLDSALSALLEDMDQRGLLDETLVVWGGEFGRTSDSQGSKGRDHNPHAFTMWMAGGGIKGGVKYGASDEFGYKAVENRIGVNDLHATILHLLGLDHKRLTYRYAGRDFRLTDVHGNVVHDILA